MKAHIRPHACIKWASHTRAGSVLDGHELAQVDAILGHHLAQARVAPLRLVPGGRSQRNMRWSNDRRKKGSTANTYFSRSKSSNWLRNTSLLLCMTSGSRKLMCVRQRHAGTKEPKLHINQVVGWLHAPSKSFSRYTTEVPCEYSAKNMILSKMTVTTKDCDLTCWNPPQHLWCLCKLKRLIRHHQTNHFHECVCHLHSSLLAHLIQSCVTFRRRVLHLGVNEEVVAAVVPEFNLAARNSICKLRSMVGWGLIHTCYFLDYAVVLGCFRKHVYV